MAPRCGRAPVEQAGGGGTKRIEAAPGDARRHPELRRQPGTGADHGSQRSRHVGGTVPGDDSQAAGEGDRTRGMRDRDRLDRRQNGARPSRRHRSFRPRRSALHRVIEHGAEAGRFVTFARIPRLRSRPCARAWQSWLRTAKHRAGAANAPATVAAPKNPQGNTFRHRSPASTGLPPLPTSGPAPRLARTPGEPNYLAPRWCSTDHSAPRPGRPAAGAQSGPNFGPKHRGTCRNRRDEAATRGHQPITFTAVSALGAVRRHDSKVFETAPFDRSGTSPRGIGRAGTSR